MADSPAKSTPHSVSGSTIVPYKSRDTTMSVSASRTMTNSRVGTLRVHTREGAEDRQQESREDIAQTAKDKSEGQIRA